MWEEYRPTKYDWPEDFELENGNYHNKCCHCSVVFIGYKRRPYCKVCVDIMTKGVENKHRLEELTELIYIGVFITLCTIAAFVYYR